MTTTNNIHSRLDTGVHLRTAGSLRGVTARDHAYREEADLQVVRPAMSLRSVGL
jgi:hypothetical protein